MRKRDEAVFYNGPVVELLAPEELASHPRLSRLGPDIIAPDYDRDEAYRRMQAQPATAIADAVIDQEVVAGIGNIYKSEGLFAASIHPQRHVAQIAREQIEDLWNSTIGLMCQGVRDRGSTHTLPENLRQGRERNWVYQRRGKQRFRCQDRVEMVRQGPYQRKTYFCPTCQR